MFPENLPTIINLPWFSNLIRIIIYFLLAWIVSLISTRIARRLIRIEQRAQRGHPMRQERQKTIQSLIASAISLIAFIAALLSSLGLFVGTDTLVWMVGLFSAAFGLGARPLISDYLAGISFIFEDTFAVGEKFEISGAHPVEGVVEAISLRATSVRANSGELYVVPNGEIRIVRNFSRGKFSLANVKFNIASTDLSRAIPFLEELGYEAVILLPNLLEHWQVVSESGVIGQETELTLVAKARFGMASEMRPRLLALVQERLLEENIPLVR
ncbi:MAG: mechanosensitive ion channel family protein [Anaerolineae bacterium]|nr:mechanosensitive ion channel family protein [Anaerolineae bacterium]